MAERVKMSSRDNSTFSNCCNNGIVQVPPERHLLIYLRKISTNSESQARYFRKNIRSNNNIMSVASVTANWIERGPGVSRYNPKIKIQ